MKIFYGYVPTNKTLYFPHDMRFCTSVDRYKIGFNVSNLKISGTKRGNAVVYKLLTKFRFGTLQNILIQGHVLMIVFHSLQLYRSLLLHNADVELRKLLIQWLH